MPDTVDGVMETELPSSPAEVVTSTNGAPFLLFVPTGASNCGMGSLDHRFPVTSTPSPVPSPPLVARSSHHLRFYGSGAHHLPLRRRYRSSTEHGEFKYIV